MRIEDLDPPRILHGAQERILEDLRWLGLDWDEGVDEGGPFAPYRQSEREHVFRDALSRLAAAGALYACTCSRAQLKGLSSAPHGAGTEGPPYPGTCREKGIPVRVDDRPRPGGRVPALRFRVDVGTVAFDDAIAGRYEQDVAREVGDFIVRRADGLYTYQLAVVADDGAMEISQVVRGVDLLHSTARQIALQRTLGLRQPEYAHVPLVLGPGGERLAKRDRASAIRAIRTEGEPPERVVGRMAFSLGLLGKVRPVRPRDLIESFTFARISRDPWRLTPAD
jgi:glutamyl-tRNA synthetase